MMGPGIALSLGFGGLRCTLLSRSEAGAAQGQKRSRRWRGSFSASGLATAEAAERGAALVTSTQFDQAVGAPDLAAESGPEEMGYKQDLFARMDAIAGRECVLASNTSGFEHYGDSEPLCPA